ncbi:hypothetical protein [Lentzea flaviverrucosa]|uniref:hypothetical protein n=1 Tax=Lentzea flaviverrucosa TaxID=200379 RepID=UPI0011C02AD6|nr:hypothetical protein [Lentzea flaviverrucosa]
MTTQLGRLVTDICRKSPNPLIRYTGRTAEAGGLLSELSHSNCTDPVVFGGDDLMQLETTNSTDWKTSNDSSTAGSASRRSRGRRAASRFPVDATVLHHVRGSPEEARAQAFLSGPNGPVLLAHDAVSVVSRHTSVGAS